MKSCKFAHTHVLVGIPSAIYKCAYTPHHTSVSEFATFHRECATLYKFFFAKIIFDNKFDIYVQRFEI